MTEGPTKPLQVLPGVINRPSWIMQEQVRTAGEGDHAQEESGELLTGIGRLASRYGTGVNTALMRPSSLV